MANHNGVQTTESTDPSVTADRLPAVRTDTSTRGI